MGKIHKLSPVLADMIAAGEVVERPASVVKELIENSIDAGARKITVEIKNGGITFIRVSDDGCGMSREDAATAFLRHATSKISTAEDLGGIATMGFRGEALAAISAVSKVELLTRTDGEELGTAVRVEAGNVMDIQPAGCPVGATMIVRELFYNTPARMKFLKRDSVEGSYLTGAVQRQALGHPEIAFRLIR
ncbi:MAG: DNA mismatch repair endonuclease MutL, partial [Oscillospiraceae bacterium]|nr:DNA mismatch repair endonuclease MutL [Oscillospiraceae bacterium]